MAAIVIVNTGCANISSVKFAVERLGYQVEVSDQADIITTADKVFLPGVGSAPAAMKSINEKQLPAIIESLTQPVLGICLGMQLMTSCSQESARHDQSETITQPCLNLIPAEVKRMQVGNLRLPHMGWNSIKAEQQHPLFKQIDDGSYFYFVHSYSVATGEYTIASCDYGLSFSAAIGKDNYYGVQFHPERSGDNGAQLLKNFLEM